MSQGLSERITQPEAPPRRAAQSCLQRRGFFKERLGRPGEALEEKRHLTACLGESVALRAFGKWGSQLGWGAGGGARLSPALMTAALATWGGCGLGQQPQNSQQAGTCGRHRWHPGFWPVFSELMTSLCAPPRAALVHPQFQLSPGWKVGTALPREGEDWSSARHSC